MLQGEHSAIRSTFIKLPFVINIFVLSILSGRFTQVLLYMITIILAQKRENTNSLLLFCMEKMHLCTLSINILITFMSILDIKFAHDYLYRIKSANRYCRANQEGQ